MTISATTQGLKPGVCTSSNRPANPYDGMMIYETDTDKVAVYDSSAWVYKTETTAPTAPGLVCVKAETAFSAVTNVTADNVFTSSYTNYVLFAQVSSSTNVAIGFQLSVGGVAATTNYNRQVLEASSTSVTASRTTAASSIFLGSRTDAGAQSQPYQFYIYQPQLAAATHFSSWNPSNNGASFNQPYIGSMFGNHSTATAYDGIKLLVATGTMTGTYAIYGYSKTV